jgi:hypothetical protein
VTGNYALDRLADRAREARQAHADYVKVQLDAYESRRAWRREHSVPAIGWCGHGRAGKDTAGEYVCARANTVYPGSCSRLVLPLLAHMIGVPEDQAWRERHDHRDFWIDACHAVRADDYAFLVKLCLGAGDTAVGIRGRLELEAVTRGGIVDLTVWVDNPRVLTDWTVEYGAGDCDLIIANHGTLLEFYRKLDRLLGVLNAPANLHCRRPEPAAKPRRKKGA